MHLLLHVKPYVIARESKSSYFYCKPAHLRLSERGTEVRQFWERLAGGEQEQVKLALVANRQQQQLTGVWLFSAMAIINRGTAQAVPLICNKQEKFRNAVTSMQMRNTTTVRAGEVVQ